MAGHGKPPEGLECMVTYDEIDESNYVEYQTAPSGKWHAAKISEDVVRRFLDTQMGEYEEHLRTSDCAATTRRLLAAGPPIWMQEKSGKAMAIPEDDTHIAALWFASDGAERPAKVKGCVEGEARAELMARNAALFGAALSDNPADDGQPKADGVSE
ncbi:hypothetical protein KFE25_010769 [Diacronema lutheri]|uniref:Uncharacterized protein n=2 Tax=Diacronema lutheri TaxID=2081491 RepID=A0A8J5XH21_DIALT|nr:hypothetical protein KFE25_010769 [Diacronema lutheri]